MKHGISGKEALAEDMTKRGPIPLLAPELQEVAPQSEETYEIRPTGARCIADW
jgi:hypothetical protein